MNNRFELPPDRLATTDESGARIYLQPDVPRGYFHRLRNGVQPLLLLIFLCVPWIRFHGEPLILLDIPHQHFIIFGGTFWAHDAPMLLFIFALFSLSVAFVTAIWGRVWCGWACPQTVFIEAVFRRIERLVEGHDRQYRVTAPQPMTLKRFLRRALKWALYFAVTLIISHSFIAYFVGVDELHRMMLRPPSEAPGWFLFVSIVTGILLFDFGWFREQFCVIACPYGRIQSLFMDDCSKVVMYDVNRGEPRRGTPSVNGTHGDCVNCYRCVQVCPTGIDIRRGTQLECIACTACIDACDDVMTKIKKPIGLIRHTSSAALAGKPVRLIRSRVLLNGAMILFVVVCLAVGLAKHSPVTVTILRAVDAPYQTVTEPTGSMVINHFHAEVLNGSNHPMELSITVDDATLPVSLISAGQKLAVPPGKKSRLDFFVKAPRSMFKEGKAALALAWRTTSEAESPGAAAGAEAGKEVIELVGPY